jgi:long-chain fatty acid transport protein
MIKSFQIYNSNGGVNMKKISKSMSAVAMGLMLPAVSYATDGYFSHGYGLKAKGMGGAATAMAQDTMGGANNPASMVWVGNRMDIGVDWFRPKRDAERSGATVPLPPPGLNGKVDSDSENFFIPEFGYNYMVSPDSSLGVTVYGNGGMNTDYPQGSFQCPTSPTTVAPANMLCGSGNLGVDLSQLIIAPTAAYKMNAAHSIGASLLLGYQRFKAEGLQAFEGLSGAPGSVTNKGYDSSTGYGIRIGYLGKLSDTVSIGAVYASKMKMGKFDKYKGLFAENGGFDIPENYNIGVAFTAIPAMTVALDYQRINYSKIASIGNASSNQAPLGASNGPGFGWQDVDVVKLGVDYKMDNQLTLRAGYNHTSNPIRSQDVSFNIIAPGVVQSHYTLGMTYASSKDSEITAAFMYAPREKVSGPSLFNSPQLFPPGGQGGNETIGMSQTSFGVAWGKKF